MNDKDCSFPEVCMIFKVFSFFLNHIFNTQGIGEWMGKGCVDHRPIAVLDSLTEHMC